MASVSAHDQEGSSHLNPCSLAHFGSGLLCTLWAPPAEALPAEALLEPEVPDRESWRRWGSLGLGQRMGELPLLPFLGLLHHSRCQKARPEKAYISPVPTFKKFHENMSNKHQVLTAQHSNHFRTASLGGPMV